MTCSYLNVFKGKKDKDNGNKVNWPVTKQRSRPRWSPAQQRIIGLVRSSNESFVLPPAVVRKALWRD